MPPPAEARLRSDQKGAAWHGDLAWLPIPLLAATIFALAFVHTQARFEPVYLLPALNILFLTIISWIVAYLAAKTYLVRGTPAVLLLGCGMWVLGITSAMAAGFRILSMDALVVTLHNCGSFLSASLILVSALLSSPRSWDKPAVGPAWKLPLLYLGSLGVMILLAIGALDGFIPQFFIPGEGATPLRQVVVIASALQFMVSSLLFAGSYRKSGTRFLKWFSMGLGLIAIGLVGVIPQTHLGSPVNWAARLAQYLGGVYILYALFTVFSQFRSWGIPVGKALYELERRHRSLVELSPDAILVHAKGKYVYANPAAARLFGARTAEDVIGRDVLELVAPEYRDLARARIERAYAGEITPLRETKFVRFDGQVIDVESTGVRVEFGGGPAIQLVVRDITERKQMEEALRRSERLYRAIGESIDYGVWVCAPDGRNIYASESFLKLVGLTQEQCSDFGWGSVLHPDDAERTIAAWKECVRTGGAWDIEHRFRGVDGLWHDVLARGVPVRDEHGRVTCWAGINLDIGRLKEAEEALRKTRDELDQRVQERTEQLSRTIDTLHEEAAQRSAAESALREQSEQLRQLASALTLAEQRERQRLAQILHDSLQQILVAAKFRLALREHLNDKDLQQATAEVGDLIDDAIETSRSLTAELSPPVLREFGLIPALEWLARWMRDRHGLTLHLAAYGQADAGAEDVTVLLFQAMRELLFNIVKHAGVKEARARVECLDGQIHVTVSDEGTGFDPSQLRVAGGHAGGFGLFSIRERLTYVGGTFAIESTLGQGTKVTLVAPLQGSPRR